MIEAHRCLAHALLEAEKRDVDMICAREERAGRARLTLQALEQDGALHVKSAHLQGSFDINIASLGKEFNLNRLMEVLKRDYGHVIDVKFKKNVHNTEHFSDLSMYVILGQVREEWAATAEWGDRKSAYLNIHKSGVCTAMAAPDVPCGV